MTVQNRDKIILTIFGALSGLAFHALIYWLPKIRDLDSLTLWVTVFFICFFGGALTMAGPVNLKRSLMPVAGFGAVVATLIFWASLRFTDAEKFIETGHPFGVVFVMFVIIVPFLIATISTGSLSRKYTDLFDALWGAVTRVVVSSAFTGIFWLLLLLSDALLELVGITLIEMLIDIDGVPPVLTGAVFGLTIVVVHELSDMISPQLILRLLRLLMPMITVVVAIFVVALPFRGLSNLFGSLSAGGVMMGMGLVAIGLVSATIDRTSAHGVQRSWMKGFVQVLACLVPILGGLAIAAVWVRVQDYGWTPNRLAAATIAITVFTYGLVYAGSILRRGDWGHRLRHGNIALAQGVLVVLALWLTPLLNPQAISARSQVARLDAGETLDKLPIYEMAHDWGHASASQVAELGERFEANGNTEGQEMIADVQAATNRWVFNSILAQVEADKRTLELDTALIIYPKGSVLPSEVLSGFDYRRREIFDICLGVDVPQSDNCVLISIPASDGQEEHFVLFTGIKTERQTVWTFNRDDGEPYRRNSESITLSDAATSDLLNGVYTIAPPRWSSVQLDGVNVHPNPWTMEIDW